MKNKKFKWDNFENKLDSWDLEVENRDIYIKISLYLYKIGCLN